MHGERAQAVMIGLPAGVGAVAAYTLFVVGGFAPIPQLLVVVAAGLFGPLLLAGSFGLREAIRLHKASALAELAFVFNAAASALVTAMLLVQIGVHDAFPPAAQRTAEMAQVVHMVDRVQLGLDISWDMFVSVGTALFGAAMLGHPKFGRLIGGAGILIGAALLILNLFAYPKLPVEVGLSDLGPLVGVWYLAVSIALLRARKWWLGPVVVGASPQPAAGASS
jgi:hypothetical protein